MPVRKKLLVVDCAALGWNLVAEQPVETGLVFRRAETVFPAVTCVAQASFRTGRLPRDHGLLSNGFYSRELLKVLFWEQSAALVGGDRIWKGLRGRGGRVAMMFWQQSLGEDVDFVLSPKPVHKHEGGMIQDCYSQPHDLYARLSGRIGRGFNLMHYWGPLASRRSSEWIVSAMCETMAAPDLAPDLLLGYLPHLDYDLQRHGPGGRPAAKARAQLHALLARLTGAAESSGYDYLIFGDYAIGAVERPPAMPNLALREAGLFRTRTLRGMLYPDLFSSEAFAMVDHEIAHVYVKNEAALRRARESLKGLPGVAEICDRSRQRDLGVDHARCADLILIAEKGSWLAYPWWTRAGEAPDFATHVDIHNKPGYDPCELFWGWPPPSVSTNPSRVKGTHGRTGPGSEIAWASSLKFDFEPKSSLDLAAAVRDWCERP
jgi:predicted AlkP superfamily pyrophosphatase or phosphodiesterase